MKKTSILGTVLVLLLSIAGFGVTAIAQAVPPAPVSANLSLSIPPATNAAQALANYTIMTNEVFVVFPTNAIYLWNGWTNAYASWQAGANAATQAAGWSNQVFTYTNSTIPNLQSQLMAESQLYANSSATNAQLLGIFSGGTNSFTNVP
jgi:hypothetical protein